MPKKVNAYKVFFELIALWAAVVLTAPSWSFANASSGERSEEIETIFIANPESEKSTTSQDSSSEVLEQTVVYFDPQDTEQEVKSKFQKVSYQDLLSQSETMRTPDYILQKTKIVQIPQSIENLEDYVDVQEMTDEGRGIFFSRNQKWLTRFAKFLTSIRLKPENINGILDQINKQMYGSAKPISESNGKRFSWAPGTSVGIGLPTWFSVWLKNQWLKSTFLTKVNNLEKVPDTWGFYLFVSLGFTIVHAKYNGKINWHARPILQIRTSKKIFLPFAVLTLGFPTGYGYVNIEKEPSAYEKFEFLKVSMPTFVKGPREFFLNLPMGVSFVPVPGAGSFAGIIGDVHQISLHPKHLPELVASVFKYFANQKMRCSYVLR